VVIPGIIGNQSSLFPFPQDLGNAFGYINYVAMEAAMTNLAACSVKTIDEALGVPSIESHMQTYASANWIFNVVRQQKFVADTPAINQEMRMTELAVCAILDKVIDMGDGDVAVGAVKAIEAGVLDSPSPSTSTRRTCAWAQETWRVPAATSTTATSRFRKRSENTTTRKFMSVRSSKV
jgi:methylaspartate mutase epsilon subunit